MISADLRRIVERLNLPWPSESWWSQSDRDKVTLANHATALVELVRACEQLSAYELQGMDLGVGARGAVLAMRDALAAVHAVKVQP